jgi:UDP-N-acetyl-D-glucosamine dehydrogenase
MATATILECLDVRIQTRQARIGVIGMGYVGLPLGLLFSLENFAVTGFDVDRSKVDKLVAGGSYIARIGSAEIMDAQRTLVSSITS